MKSDNSGHKDDSYVFFSLINAVMIVLSNVAFEQYALYKMEVERIDQTIDNLGGEFSESLLTESIIEIKNTLVNTQLVMLSQMDVLDGFNHLLAKDYGLEDTATSSEIANLIEKNRGLRDLMKEVANTSAYVSYTAPNLPKYKEEVSSKIDLLSKSKFELTESSRLVWNVGLVLILNVLVITLYSLYLFQVKKIEERGLRYARRTRLVSTVQVILGVFVIFGSFLGITRSNIPLYLMNLMLFATVILTGFHTGGHIQSKIKKKLIKAKA